MRYRTISALALVFLVVMHGSGSAVQVDARPVTQAGNPNVFGIAGHAWWLDPHVYGDQLLPALDDLGVTTVRIGIDWKRFEPAPGAYDWSMYDRVLGELARRQIVVVANFNTIPAWASVDAEGCAITEQEITHCELRVDMYPAFDRAVHSVVSRYVWITHWEFWNEPEMWTHFPGEVYVPLLKRFYETTHGVNPEVIVAANTLAGPEFVDYLYRVSEMHFGAGNEPWDAVAYHPYNLEGIQSGGRQYPDPIRFDRIVELHEVVSRWSSPDMKLWITEFGWYGDAQAQARNLVESLDWLKRQPFVEFAHLHMLHDWSEDPNQSFGLMEIVPDAAGRRGLTPATRFAPRSIYYKAFKHLPKSDLSAPPQTDGVRYFAQTGHVVSGRFLEYWDANGGLRTIGLPLTHPYPAEQTDGSWLLVQDFERLRLEYHHDKQGTRFEVLGTRIGSDATAHRMGEEPFKRLVECVPGSSRDCFAATGHSLAYGFRGFWNRHGGLSRFGYPISEELDELNPDTGRIHTVQYFERARFEYHPELIGSGFEVQLGLLGRDDLVTRGWFPPADPRQPSFRQFE
jgi:hypothetical protein